jgi:hypothetical protein
MTAGLLPSPDNLPSKETISSKQENPTNATTKPSFSTTNTEAFTWFCVQNPDFLKLIFQCFLSLVILGFCMSQLAGGGQNGNGENRALYWGGITSILAWWMPSPGGGASQNQATGKNPQPAPSSASKE